MRWRLLVIVSAKARKYLPITALVDGVFVMVMVMMMMMIISK